MAERNGGALRRVLLSADCLSDIAIFLGSVQVNTPSSRSRALLSLETLPDQRVSSDDLDLIVIHHPLSEATPAVSGSQDVHCKTLKTKKLIAKNTPKQHDAGCPLHCHVWMIIKSFSKTFIDSQIEHVIWKLHVFI